MSDEAPTRTELSVRTDIEVVCGAKECHTSKKSARSEARRLRYETGDRYRVYPCRLVIGYYHVGHVPASVLRAGHFKPRRERAKLGDKKPKLPQATRFTAADRARMMTDIR